VVSCATDGGGLHLWAWQVSRAIFKPSASRSPNSRRRRAADALGQQDEDRTGNSENRADG
jgi:hypothetical protein